MLNAMPKKRPHNLGTFTMEDYLYLLGKTALIQVKTVTNKDRQDADTSIWCPVKIIRMEVTFGRLRLLVTPVGGKGRMWVDKCRLELPAKTTVR